MKRGKKLGNATACVRRRCYVAETVINNEDLLTEILLRVPAKSLVKFILVSKKWLRLIRNPNFASLHTRHNPNLFCSALILRNLKLFSLSKPKYSGHPKNLSFLMRLGTPSRPYVEDSCNGLVLCQHSTKISSAFCKRYIVCNPTTQDSRLLPYRQRNCPHVCLVFDPLKSPHFLIVEASFDPYLRLSCEFEIYQSDLDTWTQILKFDMPKEWGSIFWQRAFCNGAIHWISEGGYHILFNPYSKELTGIKLPVHPRILPPCSIQYFGECNGRLFLIQTKNQKKPEFCVLEMGGDNCSWIATYRVNLRELMEDVPRIGLNLKIFGFSVLSVVKGGKKEDLSIVLHILEKTVSYGLQTKQWVVLDDLPDWFECYPFIESMAPVSHERRYIQITE